MIDENKIVFVVSLPRSGSTLLQHMLGAHSKMLASAEPWLLFPGIFGLKQNGLNGIYRHDICRTAISDFLGQTKEGESLYYSGLRKMYLEMVNGFATGSGKEFYVDKTSRYHLVLPEIKKTFPNAKIILLVRNPLACFSSFLSFMVDGNYELLGEDGVGQDLREGYQNIYSFYKENQDSTVLINYEDIVDAPDVAMEKLTQFIGLPFEKEMINYGENLGVLKGKLVDPLGIKKHKEPVKDYVAKWKKELNGAQERILADGFLNNLGEEVVNGLGYSYSEFKGFTSVAEGKRDSLRFFRWDDVITPKKDRTPVQKFRTTLTYAIIKKKVPLAIKTLAKSPLVLYKYLKSK